MSSVAALGRSCGVCGSTSKRSLYRQRFSGVSSHSLLHGYTIVVCEACGFGFADDIPGQKAFDDYYRDMSKYERQHVQGFGEADRIRCSNTASALEMFISDRSAKIIDIGCATGGLLGTLKRMGYRDVLGIDPSLECARAARQFHDVEVLPFTVSTMPEWRECFDAVILVSVVEHIQTLHPLLELVTGLVRDGGIVFLEHPDASRFTADAGGPFQEFSTEHINFFSPLSLANLLRLHKLRRVHSYQEDRPAAKGVEVPSASSIFRKDYNISRDIVFDDITAPSLARYIAESRAVEARIARRITEVVDRRLEIIVWGVGTHTQHLIETTRLSEANIVAFVDSNPRYEGKQLNGIPILSPLAMVNRSERILVSSMIFQEEIVRQIRDDLGLANEVIRLY
jgi:SAM-dependent methyltransferase